MRKVFLDKTTITECVGVYIYQRFADEYDIHFIFDDNFSSNTEAMKKYEFITIDS